MATVGGSLTHKDLEQTIAASAARTATFTSDDFQNIDSAKGGHLIVDVTAGTGFNLTPKIQGKDSVSGKYYDLLIGVAITATGTTVLKIYPGIAVSPNVAASDILPRTWRVVVTAADATSATYSVGVSLAL